MCALLQTYQQGVEHVRRASADLCPRDGGKQLPVGVGLVVGFSLGGDHRHRRGTSDQVLRQTHRVSHLLVGALYFGGGDIAQGGGGGTRVSAAQAEFAHGQFGQGVDVDGVSARLGQGGDRTQVGGEVFGRARAFVKVVRPGAGVDHAQQDGAGVVLGDGQGEAAVGVEAAAAAFEDVAVLFVGNDLQAIALKHRTGHHPAVDGGGLKGV